MAIYFTLRFGPGSMAPKYLQRFARAFSAWLDRQWKYGLCNPDVDHSDLNDLHNGELPLPQSLRVTAGIRLALQLPDVSEAQRNQFEEFIRRGTDTLSHDRHLEVALHPTGFYKFSKATASFERFLKNYPEISVERQKQP
jgi:hypothetical protein